MDSKEGQTSQDETEKDSTDVEKKQETKQEKNQEKKEEEKQEERLGMTDVTEADEILRQVQVPRVVRMSLLEEKDTEQTSRLESINTKLRIFPAGSQ